MRNSAIKTHVIMLAAAVVAAGLLSLASTASADDVSAQPMQEKVVITKTNRPDNVPEHILNVLTFGLLFRGSESEEVWVNNPNEALGGGNGGVLVASKGGNGNGNGRGNDDCNDKPTAPVPEPASLFLLGSGLLGLLGFGRKKAKE